MREAGDILVGTLAGMAGGGVIGTIGGWIGAFAEAYWLHAVGRMLSGRGRFVVALANAPAGSRLGLIVGVICGGVTAGLDSLLAGVVAALALAIAARVSYERGLRNPDRSDPWLRGATATAALLAVGVGAVCADFVVVTR